MFTKLTSISSCSWYYSRGEFTSLNVLIHLTGQQMKMPYIIFCALKDVPSHTELTFDYDPCLDLDKRTSKKRKGKKRKGKEVPLHKGSILCRCGEDECREWVRVLTWCNHIHVHINQQNIRASLAALKKYLPKCSITLFGHSTFTLSGGTFYLLVVAFSSMTMSCWR